MSETTKRKVHHHDYHYLTLITVIIYAFYWLHFLTFKLLQKTRCSLTKLIKTSSNNSSKHGSLKTLNNTFFIVLRMNKAKIHVQLASTQTGLKYISHGKC